MNQTKPTLIFDMDGVILDTEQLVRRCWNEIAPEFHADAIDAVFLTSAPHACTPAASCASATVPIFRRRNLTTPSAAVTM